MEKNADYYRVKAKVHAQRSFYTHLVVYLVVNIVLFLINLFQRNAGWWFWWPLAGWGIGILVQFYHTFIQRGFLGDSWEERKIDKYMERKKPKKERKKEKKENEKEIEEDKEGQE